MPQYPSVPYNRNGAGFEPKDTYMTEREKMLAGLWHDANNDKELLEERHRVELLCHAFNTAIPGGSEQESALGKLLDCELPPGLTVLAPVYFDYGKNTRFGQGVFVNHGCYFMDGGGITIGNNVFIGPFCGFYTATHPMQVAERNRGLERAIPIVVGDNCWIGANASILQGVTLGNGCVVAAGSVVTRDVPENCLVAGVPAEVKKHIDQG